MVRIIKAPKPHTPDIGDYLFGGDYLMPRPDKLLETCNPVHLTHFGYNPFRTLERIGFLPIPLMYFQNETTYKDDPYMPGQTQYGIVPELLLTQDISRYITDGAMYEKMAVDARWNRDVVYRDYLGGDETANPPQWARAMMGSGNTIGTLPSDGHGQIEFGYVSLDNGDALRCFVWEWYNK